MGSAFGQERADVSAQREAMKKLDFWVGEWKGTGWYQAGAGGKRETTITEIIRPKLGGLALLAEGLGRAKSPETGGEAMTHDALGIVCYDDKATQYRFLHYRAGDRAEVAELQLIEGGLRWERRMERGTVRFTAKIDGNRWHEVGEFSGDGKTWHQFMEMTLERQRPAGSEGNP